MKIHTRRGIAIVITTLIILVASVILGTGVVVYGSSLFQSGVKLESISVHGAKIWTNATDLSGTSWGAFAIRNIGDRPYSVDSIIIRGVNIPFSNWYYANSTNSLANIYDSFVYGSNDGSGMLKPYLGTFPSTNTCNPPAALRIDVDGTGPQPMICMVQASSPIFLKPGDTSVIYFHLPNRLIYPIDTGSNSGIIISADRIKMPMSVIIGNP